MAYEGEAGRTSTEAVHLLEADGSARTRWVHRVVNAGTDPVLARAAREGTLHRDPGHADIAVPFVYHDPDRSQFVLVVPEELRHTALEERSALWDRIAGETEHAVPRYVLDCALVIGARGLRVHLGLDPEDDVTTASSKPSPPQRGSEGVVEPLASATQERHLAEVEARLRTREERLHRWAAELRSWEDRLLDREKALQPRDALLDAIDEELRLDSSAISLDDEEEDARPISWVEGPDSVTGVRMTEPSPPPDPRHREELPTFESARPARASTDPVPAEAFRSHEGLPSGLAIPGDDPNQELVAVLHRGDVVVFVYVDDEAETALAESTPELLVQLAGEDASPGVLLTVTSGVSMPPWAARAVLDVRDPEQRAILTRLAVRYEALLVQVRDGAAVHDPILLTAPREANVVMLVERLQRTPTSEVAPAGRILSSAPPVRLDGGHPFETQGPATSAREAADRVTQLGAWASPSRMEMALLVLCIPRDRVDGTIRSVVADARAHGIALPRDLLARSVSSGVVDDPRGLVVALLEAFDATARREDRGGLTPDEIALNWERLFELCSRHQVSPSAVIEQAARPAIERLRRLSDETVDFDPDALIGMPNAQLLMLLEHAKMGPEAALALLARKDVSLLRDVFASVRRMTREDVVRVLPRIVAFGADAADVLLDGLAARKTYVRHASVLGLARLGSPRAVEPALELLLDEASEVWREIARILPAFGPASGEALARMGDEGLGDDARIAFAFAHLAARGQLEMIEAIAESATGRGSQLATRGLSQRDRALAHAAQVAEEAALEADDRVLRFSAQLERALAAVPGIGRKPTEPASRRL
jgi:hypothetical protein